MKKLLFLLIICIIIAGAPVFTGCGVVPGSGETQTFQMDYTKFSRLEIGTGFQVEIDQADVFYVSITIDKALYEYLNIAQRGDTLHIGLKPNNTYTAAERTAIIRLPDIRRLDLSSGSQASLTGFTLTHEVDFILSGGSKLVLNPTQTGDANFELSDGSTAQGNIQMNNASLNLSSGSIITLNGAATGLKITASGGSHAGVKDIPVPTANINLDSGSRAEITVSDVLDVKLSGGSDLEYTGSPKMGTMNISGGSQFNQVQQ